MMYFFPLPNYNVSMYEKHIMEYNHIIQCINGPYSCPIDSEENGNEED